jgi:hypothetical protein
MIYEFERVVLTVDIPHKKLQKGDIGTVVLVYPKATLASTPSTGFEVEFFTIDGNTLTVETLLPHQIRPVKTNELAHVREVANF